MTDNFKHEWADMPAGEKNVLVRDYLKTLNDWDLKRMMCDTLEVEHYMDDYGLLKAVRRIINVR